MEKLFLSERRIPVTLLLIYSIILEAVLIRLTNSSFSVLAAWYFAYSPTSTQSYSPFAVEWSRGHLEKLKLEVPGSGVHSSTSSAALDHPHSPKHNIYTHKHRLDFLRGQSFFDQNIMSWYLWTGLLASQTNTSKSGPFSTARAHPFPLLWSSHLPPVQ